MRIIYVTARLPHGATEAFMIPEIRQLLATGHEVLLIPRSCDGPIIHGNELLEYSWRESFWSRRIWRSALRVGMAAPMRTLAAAMVVRGSRSSAVMLKNLAVAPKALWLSEVATRWHADHMHCHWAGTTATMTWIASEISGVPWSFTAHRWDIVENNLLREKARCASFARFISEDGLRMARALGVEPRAHTTILRMGVALPQQTPRKTRSTGVVLCPARLTEVKGHRRLLAAWRILKNRGRRGELWLAGDGELRAELEGLARELSIGESVRFLGAVPHAELLKMYEDGAIDAVVLASLDLGRGNHEGIPVALVEAMSFGIPVVATASGGTAELVLPGTGFLVPPGDAEAITNALDRLLMDETLRRQLGDAGRRRAVEAHDVVRVGKELVNAFEAARQRTPVAA